MRMTRTLRRGAALLCLTLSLGACASSAPIVRTETVTVKVPTYVRIDPKLTRVEAEPDLPIRVNDDLTTLIDELRAWGRDMVGRLLKIEGLQPAKDQAP